MTACTAGDVAAHPFEMFVGSTFDGPHCLELGAISACCGVRSFLRVRLAGTASTVDVDEEAEHDGSFLASASRFLVPLLLMSILALE